MKQSTKLLSLVLALVMAFSCLSVIGNAGLVTEQVVYDNIDEVRCKYFNYGFNCTLYIVANRIFCV